VYHFVRHRVAAVLCKAVLLYISLYYRVSDINLASIRIVLGPTVSDAMQQQQIGMV